MSQDIYRQLQERLDMYSVGFPATASGIELTILKTLFSEKDAQLFLNLSPILETPESISDRIGRQVEETSDHLADMARRGLLFCLKRAESIKYGAIPFIHGLYEFQVKRIDRNLSALLEEYLNTGFYKALGDNVEGFMRVIPIQHSLDTSYKIAPYEDACELLREQKTIIVTECICRKAQMHLDKGCGKPLEVCFMFGSMAEFYLHNNMGRLVDVEEAIEILSVAQEAGLVTQPATAQNPSGMCNCCGDCCGVLKALNMLPDPADLVFSNYFAMVDMDKCTGCEACLDRCQVSALSMTDEKMQINPVRCIGCGLCVTTCHTEAIHLEMKPKEKIKIPPLNGYEQMMNLAIKRGVHS
jgi:ferredoxin